jgi:transposase InsO family protein
LSILGISKHQYYYKNKGTRPGRKPTTTTLQKVNQDIIEVNNEQVVEQIKHIQSDPDTDCGYRKMFFTLMILGYFINHKKIYRLMKENNLLKQKHKKKDKVYAKYRIVIPDGPLQVLEMDIKYIWVTQARRNAYTLTIIDTFTRAVLNYQVGFTMKSQQVKKAWEKVITDYLQPADLLNKGIHVEIRNDNGPQFISKLIQEFFKENYLNQVFTHPYTPQENGHIESFHAILSKAIGENPFWDLAELEARLRVFYKNYNYIRLHGSIAFLPPMLFWKLWEQRKIERKVINYKKVKFKLLIPYQQLSGNEYLREVPCLNKQALDETVYLQNEVIRPEILQQLSVQRKPSVVPC